MDISSTLVAWYTKNKRNLPWRKTKDPYKIWLSEIILQQTRVEQGLSYYLAFCKKYPTVFELAADTESNVIKLWQGLGYYSRARNLHGTAKEIVAALNGKFPENYSGLIKLKGIGPYSAAAIASIAYEEKVPVIDGNVIRVITRIYGIESDVGISTTKKLIKSYVEKLIENQKPSVFNQAVMEFGALFCTPKNPHCSDCVFKTVCKAYLNKRVEKIPNKARKVKIVKKYFYYFSASVGRNKNKLFFKKRLKNDIWQNLFDFPLIESEKRRVINKTFMDKSVSCLFGEMEYSVIEISSEHIHKLSHREIEARFIRIHLSKMPEITDDNTILAGKREINTIAVSRLLEKYLSTQLL